MLAYLLAALVIGAAVYIAWRRARAFIRTKGLSACENCPYSGHCGGKCGNRDRR